MTYSNIEKPDVASFLQRAKKNIAGKPSYICPACGNGGGKHGTGITCLLYTSRCV